MATSPNTRQATVQPVYEDFKPKSEWKHDQTYVFVLVSLPGFMEDNFKATIAGENVIRVRGERLVTANKWLRILEDYKVPNHCNMEGIRTMFIEGTLYLIMPKKKKMAEKGFKDEAKPSQEQAFMSPQNPKENHPKESTPIPQKGQDHIPSKANPNEKPEAKSIRDSSLPPQETRQSLLRETNPNIGNQTKLTPSGVIDDKGKEQMYPKPFIAQNVTNEENSTSGEKSESLSPNTMLSEKRTQKGQDKNDKIEPKAKEKNKGSTLLNEVENVPEIVEESTLEKHDGAGFALANKNENVEGKDEKSSKSENDEKGKGSALLNTVKTIASEIAEKTTQDKDGVGFALADKNENIEPKANQTKTNVTASASSRLRLEKYKQSLKGLMELDEEKQLMVNVGVAMFVIVALGTYVVYRTRK